MTNTIFLWRSLLCAVSIVIAASANAQNAKLDPLKVAIVSRTVFYAPLWVAQKNGFFEAEGLDVRIEVFDNAERISESLKSGTSNIAISTPEGVILDSMKGGSLRVIGGNAKRLPHFVIAKPAIKKPEELRGANFGVLSLNEGTTYLVREYARSIGLASDSYKVSQVGGAPTRWKLLKEGKIDAGLQPFPLSYEAEREGFTNLGPISRVVPEWQFTSINVVLQWAQSNRSSVAKFLRALRKGHIEMERDQSAAALIIAKELGTDPSLALRALGDTKSLDILAPDLRYSVPGLQRVFHSLIETGQIKESTEFNLKDIVDESFISALEPVSIREIGGFFVGGHQAEIKGLPTKNVRYAENMPSLAVDPNGTYSTGHVYVQYARLSAPTHSLPVVFLNGGTSTGAMWETTPDGRPGWQMHFLRQGYDTYLTDAVGKGRASWSRYPEIYKAEPTFRSHEETWKTFRIGTRYDRRDLRASAFKGTQFPVESFDHYAKQAVPRFAGQDDIELHAYGDLITKTGPCIVVGQSSGVNFALLLALAHPEKIKAVIGVEPTAFPAVSAQADLDILRKLPQFFLWGDHVQWFPMWQKIRGQADAYTRALVESDNRLTVVDLPAIGIVGNSHQLMMDRNSDDIAQMATRWLSNL